MNKSIKLVSLFLTTALILGTSGCGAEEQVYDEEGNPIVQQYNSSRGFFAPLGSFGHSSKRSYGATAGSVSGTTQSSGVSVGGQSSSTSTSGGTGVTSGSHGGIGGGGSSVS